MATSVIRNFIAKALFKKKGAIASSKAVDFSANALEQRLKNIGVDPNAITSENELNQILSYVKQAEDQAFKQNFGNMLGGSKFDRVGEVFDMTGKKLDSSRGTIGGTQIDENTLKEGLMKTDNPFSDLVKTTDQGPKTLAEREAEVLARLEKENKEAAQRIRDRKKLDDPEDMATGGRAGYKFGIGPLFNFLNKKSPMKAYTDYLDSIKTRMKAGKEAEVAGEVIPVAATGALITNQLKKKLKAMNEEQKKEFKKEMEKKADGGRIGLMTGSVPKIFKFLKNKKKIDEAVNNIFPTGDYKYDAQLAADSLVENNPQIFGGKLYEDLDIDTQMEVYGAVIGPIQNNALTTSRIKKATKPEKTLQSMKDGKGINMSDPEIAEEFSRFMKETDPEGTKKLKQTLELDTFDPTGRKKNADGGRIGLRSGLSKAFLEFLKKFKVNQSGDDLKDFLSKRQFMKDIVGNTEKNRKARQLAELKEAMEETRKNPGFEFPSGEELRVDIEKEIAPILLKDRKLNATGGRIGLEGGTNEDFQKYLKERERFEKERSLEQLFKEYQEDLRRQEVGEQKQMAANGGRIGLKAGMTKRAFLKLMGGVGATIGAAKSGIFSGLGKGAGKQVAKEVAQQTTSSTPPPYFFKLVEKIKTMGDETLATKDKAIAKKYKDYTMEEDFAGNIEIIKKGDDAAGNKIEDVYMSYKVDEVPVKGKKGSTKVEEYEEFTARPDGEGKMKDIEPGVPDEVIEEGTMSADNMTEFGKINKASGGIARMLGE